jgi:hypothetical protein
LAIFNPKEMFSTDILIAHFDVRAYQSHLCKMLDLKIKEGVKAVPLLDGAEISTMSQLALWTVKSEKVLVF